MKQIIAFIYILMFFPYNAYAISHSLKQVYPNSILTDDYGILNEQDLKDEKPAPFSMNSSPGGVYWQCFSRNDVSVNLEDMGYTSEDIGGIENYSGLRIIVSNSSGISHEYDVRRIFPLSVYERKFDVWIKLMKGEKYACLAGEFFECKEKSEGKKICHWTFEKLKTKKGSDSYFVK